ncbi:Panacea domain-containing protein ['Camptotheca acuminata' phytoplasma]|uniref:Panacea domain-containing protein n=1 Tax='Camptotheca acuminata' phytoplasma TaxID=3239192 RepID=UPI003519FE2F
MWLNYVIEKIGDVTNMKLHKLIYYIQGVYLAKYNEKMFDSALESWLYGPIFPELYLQIYKNSYHPVRIIEKGDKNKITEKQAKIIDLVIEKQGYKTAGELSEQTHNESPWLEAF